MSRKTTISDIAVLAGVSKATVSFYLNGKFSRMSEDTRKRIEQAIAKTNYQLEGTVSQRGINQKHLIGVVIGDITSPFASHIVKGLEDYTREKNYQLILGSSNYLLENERRCIDGMNEMGVGGFVVQPTAHFETMWQGLEIDKPLVYFDSPNHSTKGLWVKTNNYEAVYDAVSLLLKRGYHRFILVTADPSKIVTREERCRGFTDHLDIRKVPYDVITAEKQTDPEDLQKQLQVYINGKEDICIFASSNWLLNKVHLALEPYRSWIPRRLGLIGMDSCDWSELVSPTITTIVQPAYEEGRVAAKILIDRMEGIDEEPPNQILKCRINEMSSTRHNEN
ncbi:MAG: LacI family DNA-binding transcriptional regulator [Erysipelotrichia bacterium]|nr:LacI family DNA-binding transcriptional regulator [Erysipelotrichia bacterium]